MLDAIPITLQPYNSANTLANSVGIAIWNNTLFHKSGNIWYYTSNNSAYSPCASGFNTDFNSLQCYRAYQVDYGWRENNLTPSHSIVFQSSYYWDGTMVCHSPYASCTSGNSTYYRGLWDEYYVTAPIRRVDNLTEYKTFSTF